MKPARAARPGKHWLPGANEGSLSPRGRKSACRADRSPGIEGIVSSTEKERSLNMPPVQTAVNQKTVPRGLHQTRP